MTENHAIPFSLPQADSFLCAIASPVSEGFGRGGSFVWKKNSFVSMGRKKKQTDKEYIWCYYCDREFDDENTLVSHQVARHFKCEECGKKLGTFRALMAHSKTNHHLDLQK